MNKKYMLHPGDYAIGESEKLYSDMAAKGWLLEKRGTFLSKFRKSERAHLRYRIELASPDTSNGETELPEEQLALYEECGWSYVTGDVFIHIFSAPEASNAPEVYTDPRQQAATLKGLRRYNPLVRIQVVVLITLNFFLRRTDIASNGSVFKTIENIFTMGWITYTAFILLYAFILLWTLYTSLHRAVCTAQLSRKLNRGQPIDHAPKSRRLLHHTVNGILLVCCAVCFVLTTAQLVQNKKYVIPTEADGPYLLLKDLGWDGKRINAFNSDRTNRVETKHSLIADQWYTSEYVSAGGSYSSIKQQIFELRDKRLVRNLVALLMANSMHSSTIFDRVDVPGLDEAYWDPWEYIAVKGSTVYYIYYNDPDNDGDQRPEVDVLAVLAKIRR